MEEGEEALEEFASSTISPAYRAVTIVDAGERKRLELRVEVPVEDMSRLDKVDELAERSGIAGTGAHIDLERDPSEIT